MAKKGESNQVCCSFCGKSESEVQRLISGPGVYICNECISLCNGIMGGDFDEVSEYSNIDFSELPKPKQIKEVLDPANIVRLIVVRLPI